jgi:PmbA protein
MEKVLSLAMKVAQQAEVFQVFSQKTPVSFEANRLKQIQSKESSSIALRIIKDGKVGFAQASGTIEAQTLVNMALDTSKFGAEAKFEFPGPIAYPQVQIYDSRVDETSIDAMVGFGEQLIAAIRQHTPDIQCEASIGKGSASVRIINSLGGQSSYKKTFFSVGIEGIIIRDDDMLFVGDSQSSCHPLLDAKGLVAEVILQLELAKNKASISAQPMPVIFRPNGVASALVTPLITAFNGKIVFMGASPLKGKLGSRIFDDSFSVWDDATIPYQVASCPCDDEGIPGQRTSLVEHGTVSHFLYDLQTAGMANTRSTGNGGRNGGLPTPSSNSLIIGSGKVAFQDMVRDIKLGLVVEQLMGASQGNVLNGDFSGNVLLGFKIENGEITGRVKNTMVSGNIYTDLKRIVAIGQDTRWVGGTLQTPSIYCSNLAVASKEG